MGIKNWWWGDGVFSWAKIPVALWESGLRSFISRFSSVSPTWTCSGTLQSRDTTSLWGTGLCVSSISGMSGPQSRKPNSAAPNGCGNQKCPSKLLECSSGEVPALLRMAAWRGQSEGCRLMRLGQGSRLSTGASLSFRPLEFCSWGAAGNQEAGSASCWGWRASAWGKGLRGTSEHGGCGAQRSQGIQRCHKSHHGALDHLGVS